MDSSRINYEWHLTDKSADDVEAFFKKYQMTLFALGQQATEIGTG